MEDYLLFQALKLDILTEESMKVIHSTPPSFPRPERGQSYMSLFDFTKRAFKAHL